MEYGAATTPGDNGEFVVMDSAAGAGSIVMANPADAVWEPPATWIVKLKIPAVVGVPPIAPAPDNVKPAGKDPDARVHAYGVAPPVAANV